MALLPPFLQSLMGYPVMDVGLLLAPRGLGTMLAMAVVGRLAGRVDERLAILAGLLLTGWSLWDMTAFTLEVPSREIVRTGFVQGLGLGMIFVPLSTLTFSTLPVRYRDDGAALFSLMRNIGSSIGVSLVVAELARCTQRNHAVFAESIDPFRPALREAVERGIYDLGTPAGLMALDAEVKIQSATLAYLQDFRLMMFVTLGAVPLLLLLRHTGRKNDAVKSTGMTS